MDNITRGIDKYKNGVGFYTKALAVIWFPEDKVCCRECPLLSVNQDRRTCRLNNQVINKPQFVGDWCPLIIEEEEHHGNV